MTYANKNDNTYWIKISEKLRYIVRYKDLSGGCTILIQLKNAQSQHDASKQLKMKTQRKNKRWKSHIFVSRESRDSTCPRPFH